MRPYARVPEGVRAGWFRSGAHFVRDGAAEVSPRACPRAGGRHPALGLPQGCASGPVSAFRGLAAGGPTGGGGGRARRVRAPADRVYRARGYGAGRVRRNGPPPAVTAGGGGRGRRRWGASAGAGVAVEARRQRPGRAAPYGAPAWAACRDRVTAVVSGVECGRCAGVPGGGRTRRPEPDRWLQRTKGGPPVSTGLAQRASVRRDPTAPRVPAWAGARGPATAPSGVARAGLSARGRPPTGCGPGPWRRRRARGRRRPRRRRTGGRWTCRAPGAPPRGGPR